MIHMSPEYLMGIKWTGCLENKSGLVVTGINRELIHTEINRELMNTEINRELIVGVNRELMNTDKTGT